MSYYHTDPASEPLCSDLAARLSTLCPDPVRCDRLAAEIVSLAAQRGSKPLDLPISAVLEIAAVCH